jgi:hypothetical protein
MSYLSVYQIVITCSTLNQIFVSIIQVTFSSLFIGPSSNIYLATSMGPALCKLLHLLNNVVQNVHGSRNCGQSLKGVKETPTK